MAIGDTEQGFGSMMSTSAGCIIASFAVLMAVVAIGGLCCLFGGAIACGHRILQDGFANDPRFSAPILSSFVGGIVGCTAVTAVVFPCWIIFSYIKGSGSVRSVSKTPLLTVGILLKRVYQWVPLSVATGVARTAILRHDFHMVALAPGWAAVCGLLGSVVISTGVGIVGVIMISCGLCAGFHDVDF